MNLKWIGIALAVTIAQAQSQPGKPEFEVASVKFHSNVAGPGRIGVMHGGRFKAENWMLLLIIAEAWNVDNWQVLGAPAWIKSARYDITAKAAEDDAAVKAETYGHGDRTRLMLRSLLEDRFRLRAHTETREGPVYEMTVSSGGSKLMSSECTTFEAPTSGELRPCGSFTGYPMAPNATLAGKGIPMTPADGPAIDTLASQLSIILRRTVVDKTEITGRFDFHMEWSNQDMAMEPVSADASAPGIFTAMQQQLGLKLAAARGPVEYLVIDQVERPDPN